MMNHLEDLKRELSEGRLSRREFIRRFAALGMVAAIPALVWQEEALANEPQKGGRLRMGVTGGATSDVLEPAKILDIMVMNLSYGQLRNNLTEVNSAGELIGELAESWEPTPDAKTWTFKLRKGVEFHNGKSLSPEDVIYSFNEHRGEKSTSGVKGLLKDVTDIKADGKDHVVFTLSAGNADFPMLLTDYHFPITPADTSKEDYEKGIGTGGYTLVEWEPGVRAVTKRFPNYWKEGRAHFDEIETLGILDTNARSTGLLTGELDMINSVDLKTYKRLERPGKINIIKTSGTKHMTVPMITTKAPFDNNDVRLAVKYAIDRKQWVEKILKGFGRVGNDHPISVSNRYYNADLPQRAYDPEKAKHHLKKAGMDSLKIDLSAAETAFNGAVDAAVLFKDSAAKAGIDINVVVEPNDGYWSSVWMKKPFSMSYLGGRPMEDWVFTQSYSEGAEWNETYWSNEKFNKLLVEARAELDSKKRAEMYGEMQKLVNEDSGVIIPMFADYVMATSAKLSHPEKLGANWEMDGMKLAERWWFNS